MANYIRFALVLGLYVLQFASAQTYNEIYRPQCNFTPLKNWMNDPNGLLYYNGVYHMYYQYNPGGTTWGRMSWGHATSSDLTHWQRQPIALLARGYPGTSLKCFSRALLLLMFKIRAASVSMELYPSLPCIRHM